MRNHIFNYLITNSFLLSLFIQMLCRYNLIRWFFDSLPSVWYRTLLFIDLDFLFAIFHQFKYGFVFSDWLWFTRLDKFIQVTSFKNCLFLSNYDIIKWLCIRCYAYICTALSFLFLILSKNCIFILFIILNGEYNREDKPYGNEKPADLFKHLNKWISFNFWYGDTFF